MNENWYVLAVAVLNEKVHTIEQAFETYDKGKFIKRKLKSKEDLEDMLKLRKTMTLKEIAEIYGSTESSVCHLIKKYERS